MRWSTLSAVVIFAAAMAFGSGVTAPASASTPEIDVAPADPVLRLHPIVGSWVEQTPAGVVLITFAPDGSVIVEGPEDGSGRMASSYIGPGHGAWHAVGQRGVLSTVVRPVSRGNGVPAGAVTIQRSFTLADDGAIVTDDSRLTIFITRDAGNHITSVTGSGADAPMIVATRIGIGQTGIAHKPAADTGTADTARVGCRPCP